LGYSLRLVQPIASDIRKTVGPLVCTLMQSVGLGLALIAGVATVIAWFGHRNRD
jgi:hypothetical protein